MYELNTQVLFWNLLYSLIIYTYDFTKNKNYELITQDLITLKLIIYSRIIVQEIFIFFNIKLNILIKTKAYCTSLVILIKFY